MNFAKIYDHDKLDISASTFTAGEEKVYTFTFDFAVESIISIRNFDYFYHYIDVEDWSISGNQVSITLKNSASATYSNYAGLLFCSVSGSYV